MLQSRPLLAAATALACVAGGLAGCGQTGPLYLPTEPAAARRATLPEVLLPGTRDADAPAPASAPTPKTGP